MAEANQPEAAKTDDKPAEPAAATPTDAKPQGRIQKLLTKNPQVVASVVLGVVGLIATSIWQYRQQQTQKAQADAAQKVVETQAANSWKIERTEILGKNLGTLAMTGPETADQRYGVLLSLIRAEVIDPELAMSYALELGRDNAEYMVSVLQNTLAKDYERLLRAYELTCDEKYGVDPAVDSCAAADKLAPRSMAIGRIIAEDTTSALASDVPGPLVVLKDERHVQYNLARLAGLFQLTLLGLYDHHAWDDLAKFASSSAGAHLVMSLVLAAARDNSLATDDEQKTLDQFHAAQTKFLTDYLTSKACDASCKGQMIDVMITRFSESQGDYDAAFRKLLEGATAQSQKAVTRLHDRLLACQVSPDDLAALRDRVLVPAASDLLQPKADAKVRDAVLGVLAVTPEPSAADAAANPAGKTAYASLVARIEKDPTVAKPFNDRRAAAARQRLTPTARRTSFCNVPAASATTTTTTTTTTPTTPTPPTTPGTPPPPAPVDAGTRR